MPILGAARFVAIGPIASSTTTAWQSSIGLVEASSLFAWCQSAAIGGVALNGIFSFGLGVAIVPVILGLAEKFKSVFR
jgi:hypothetical protein